ncbi:MAG TPA: hypothetical protein VH496_13965 [Mycobacterium sp.]
MAITNIPSSGVGITNQTPFGNGNGPNVLLVKAFNSTSIDAIVGDSTSGGRNGVIGIAHTGVGVSGQIPATSSANTIAVYGQNYSTYAGAAPGAGGFGVYGLSAKGHGLVGATATAGGAAVVGATNGVPGAFAAAFYGPVIIGGDFTVVGGAKSAAVPHPDGTHRRLYCVESPESWFEDFGRGELTCGQADIAFDADFAAVADVSDYHVFLTPCDTHIDLCVTEQTTNGFRVLARDAASGGRFSWRVVARRKDIAGQRFATVTIPPEPALPAPVTVETVDLHARDAARHGGRSQAPIGPERTGVLPETEVTEYSGDMGDTVLPTQEGACLGRSVTSWTSACALWPACSTARRWRSCARSSGSPARRATKSTSGTRRSGPKD